jgi:predicted lipoprotein with Yx(FWY)xxD motif
MIGRPSTNRHGALLAAMVVTLISGNGQAETASPAPATRAYQSVGTGLHRDLPPAQLIPDATPAPKGASEGYPAGVAFRDSPLGLVYTTADGKTLYAMRVARLRYPGAPETYCVGPCIELWPALKAPADAVPVGAWHVVKGAQGPQWAYGSTPVFVYAGDNQPQDINGHEFEDMFFAINYVPPVPTVKAPGGIEPLLLRHREYVLSYRGQPLYRYPGERGCGDNCDVVAPLAAPLGAQPVGEWAVAEGTDRPSWTYSGQHVFVSTTDGHEVLDDAALIRLR